MVVKTNRREQERGRAGLRRDPVVIGRDVVARVGLRVQMLDALADLRDCSQSTAAIVYSHGLPPAALGLIVKVSIEWHV